MEICFPVPKGIYKREKKVGHVVRCSSGREMAECSVDKGLVLGSIWFPGNVCCLVIR